MHKQLVLSLLATLLIGCTTQPTASVSNFSEPPETQGQQIQDEAIVVDKTETLDETISEEQSKPGEEILPETFWNRFHRQMTLVDQYDHPRINKHLNWFTDNQTYFDRVMDRGQKYIYYILEQIEQKGIPVEIALLPIIESAYDPYAYSHSHASGLWQFIPSTGQLYGLKKDWWYDGRRDIVASTDAALTYLTYLHELFDGDWLLALAAYNSGQGNVSRAIKKNRRLGRPVDFWSLNLPKETQAYVPQLLAVAKVFQHPEKYNIIIKDIPNEPYFSVLELSNQIDLNKASDMAGIDNELLSELNPAFNRPVTHPDGPHQLLLPTASATAFNSAISALPVDYWQPNKIYRVKKGDSLYTIARQHHITIGQLKELNQLTSNTLQIGQRLDLPGFGSGKLKTPVSRKSIDDIYHVKQGDTLWDIARAHNVAIKDLIRWNQLDKHSTLQPEQKLKLVKNTNSVKKRVKKVNYKVRRGDSLSRIASKFNLRIKDILHWNSIDLQGYLKPGQRLTLFVDIRNI